MATAAKIPFGLPYGEKGETFYTEPGTQIENEYGYEIDSKGRKVLVKIGERNQYEEIQSYLEETKIENILKRVAVGDMSDFRPDGIYADITEIPNNLIEARQNMQKVENLFNSLPMEIKEKYNFNPEEYMAAMGTEEWLIDSGFMPKKEEKVEEKINKTEETVEKTE